MIGRYGREVVRVNPSLPQGSEKAKPTNVTYGQTFSDLSERVDLRQCLVNRLKARMDGFGSLEYELTWVERDTGSETPVWLLRASARRTSGTGFGGWPSPMAGSPATETYNEAGNTDSSRKTVSLVAGWNTPRSTDGSNGGPNQAGGALSHDVALAGWATPNTPSGGPNTKSTATHTGGMDLEGMASGAIATSSPVSTEKRGALSPAHSRWLMGFPSEWDREAPLKAKVGSGC